MTHERFITHTILFATLMISSLMILPGLSQGEDLVKGAMVIPEVANQGIERIGAESVQDSLKACLDRIPTDATVGQLMLAEQNCQHVARERTKTFLSF